MSSKKPTDLAASVRARLHNIAKKETRQFSEVLQFFAMERFLYRVSQSIHTNRYILKGALMLRVWESPQTRPTMDIDLLGFTDNDLANIKIQMQDIISTDVEADGLIFDLPSVDVKKITEEAEYDGARATFKGKLGNAKITMQIDIGFGDIVHPAPSRTIFPTILDFPPPNLLCYSRESAISEKFQAMIKHGALNSRMKDFFDIWLLSRQFDFDGQILQEAVRSTFEQRDTPITDDVISFTNDFVTTKQRMWTVFRNKLEQEYIPHDFSEIVNSIRIFLKPIVWALISGENFSSTWKRNENWQ